MCTFSQFHYDLSLPHINLQSMLQLKIGTKATQIQNSQNQKNILEIGKLIDGEKHNQKLATLYTNRAVLQYRSGKNQEALSDLQKALEYNYLNYAVYFNMFSLFLRDGLLVEGLKSLCCALSCLYLIRGKRQNCEADISKCVKLAENNCEGRLLKALHYERRKKHNLALNQIQWVLDTEPHNLEIIQIKNYIDSLIQSTKNRYNRDGDSLQSGQENISIQVKNVEKKKSLKCTLYDDLSANEDLNYESEIATRLEEFNRLVEELVNNIAVVEEDQINSRLFFVEEKQSIGQNQRIQQSANSQQYQQQYVQELKVNTSQQNQVSKSSETKKNLSEPILSLGQSSSGPHTPLALQQAGSTDSYFIGSNASRESSLARSGLDAYILGNDRSKMSGSLENNGSFTTIKAKDDLKSIKIKVENIHIIDTEDEDKYNNMYCLFEYGESKITLINSTGQEDKKNQEINCTDEEEGKKLTVKLFNKQILAFNDRFLGQGVEQIREPGIYTVTLYSGKYQGHIVGQVEFSIQMS